MSATLGVEFPQEQCIDFSEIIHVLKAVAIVTSQYLNLSTIFVVSHFLIAMMTPEWGPRKSVPFP